MAIESNEEFWKELTSSDEFMSYVRHKIAQDLRAKEDDEFEDRLYRKILRNLEEGEDVSAVISGKLRSSITFLASVATVLVIILGLVGFQSIEHIVKSSVEIEVERIAKKEIDDEKKAINELLARTSREANESLREITKTSAKALGQLELASASSQAEKQRVAERTAEATANMSHESMLALERVNESVQKSRDELKGLIKELKEQLKVALSDQRKELERKAAFEREQSKTFIEEQQRLASQRIAKLVEESLPAIESRLLDKLSTISEKKSTIGDSQASQSTKTENPIEGLEAPLILLKTLAGRELGEVVSLGKRLKGRGDVEEARMVIDPVFIAPNKYSEDEVGSAIEIVLGDDVGVIERLESSTELLLAGVRSNHSRIFDAGKSELDANPLSALTDESFPNFAILVKQGAPAEEQKEAYDKIDADNLTLRGYANLLGVVKRSKISGVVAPSLEKTLIKKINEEDVFESGTSYTFAYLVVSIFAMPPVTPNDIAVPVYQMILNSVVGEKQKDPWGLKQMAESASGEKAIK